MGDVINAEDKFQSPDERDGIVNLNDYYAGKQTEVKLGTRFERDFKEILGGDDEV